MNLIMLFAERIIVLSVLSAIGIIVVCPSVCPYICNALRCGVRVKFVKSNTIVFVAHNFLFTSSDTYSRMYRLPTKRIDKKE